MIFYYCNTEMSKLFQEMYELNETKKPIDMRLRACERAIERYRLQLKGACEAKERMYSRRLRFLMNKLHSSASHTQRELPFSRQFLQQNSLWISTSSVFSPSSMRLICARIKGIKTRNLASKSVLARRASLLESGLNRINMYLQEFVMNKSLYQ